MMQELANSHEVIEKMDEEKLKKPPPKSLVDVFEDLRFS